ncbi:hypothetical protein AB0D12_39455 [Streptomyces sp. NPDC048479]|uniref:hypothetical protein n=1 Tax=Streptomyces sp. NPDC048479 TaxID=3154725 RepID=UPI00341C56DE
MYPQSRNLRDLTAAFPEIASAATALGEDAVLDGEAVIHRGGRLDFAALQARMNRRPDTVAHLAAGQPAPSSPSTCDLGLINWMCSACGCSRRWRTPPPKSTASPGVAGDRGRGPSAGGPRLLDVLRRARDELRSEEGSARAFLNFHGSTTKL